MFTRFGDSFCMFWTFQKSCVRLRKCKWMIVGFVFTSVNVNVGLEQAGDICDD